MNAYKLSYRSIRKENEIQKAEMAHFQNCGGIKEVLRKNMENNSKATALKMVRRLFEEDLTSYTKVPFVFEGHLFFCSPSYGSKDYNKTMTCAIVGNEKFIERIEKLCERIISKKNH